MIILTYVKDYETFQIRVRYVKPVSNIMGKEGDCRGNTVLCLTFLKDNDTEYTTIHDVSKWSCMIASS